MAGYAINRPADRAWTPTRTRAEHGRAIVDLTAELRMERSRARLWRYPTDASGVPHVEREQEEVFVVLNGTLTLMLGDPAQREVLPAGSIAAIQPGTPVHVRNDSEAEATFLAYGAPPVVDAADELSEPGTT
jgi:quercetin dioxygenase-like cupin family protein